MGDPGMTSDYVLSHYDAMALWDAVLDTAEHACTAECGLEDDVNMPESDEDEFAEFDTDEATFDAMMAEAKRDQHES